MDFRLEICPDQRVYICHFRGALSLEGMLAGYRQSTEIPDWQPDWNYMTVLESADLGALGFKEIERLMGELEMFDSDYNEDNPKRGAIVCDLELARALLNFWEARAVDHRTTRDRVFTSEEEAMQWLARPVSAARPGRLP
jgi:hypothetical protein